MTKKGVSVVICCYNSANRIMNTINYLSRQHFEDEVNWEIIVVNNASTDETFAVAQKAIKQYSSYLPDCKIIDEEKPGLSFARDRGVSEAKYEYIIFCDDDNWLNKDYVYKVYKILDSDMQIAAVGGENVLKTDCKIPNWFYSYSYSYAIGKQGLAPEELINKDKYLVGAGLSFRKSIYEIILKKKRYLTDRVGDKVIGGGDIELCYMFRLLGYDILYNEQLKLFHYMPENRLTQEYLVKMWRNYNYSWLVFEAYKYLLCKKNTSRFLLTIFFLKLFFFRLAGKLFFFPKYVYLKFKGKIMFYLKYETELFFDFYLLYNMNSVKNKVKEIEKSFS